MVYSITNRTTFDDLHRQMIFAAKARDSEKFPVIIVGYVLSSNFLVVLILLYLVICAI
jgi:hypothetical protein